MTTQEDLVKKYLISIESIARNSGIDDGSPGMLDFPYEPGKERGAVTQLVKLCGPESSVVVGCLESVRTKYPICRDEVTRLAQEYRIPLVS
ncbi:MAG: hypothetical protein NT076_01005 [Candidatus Pacearchaeota archaeon]|nr:hypothetical protein [Candidatus Pacearchaeota archaeon]